MNKHQLYNDFFNLDYNRITKKQKNKARKYITSSLHEMYELEEAKDIYNLLGFIPCNCYNLESKNPNYKVLLTAHYDTHGFRANYIQSYLVRKFQSKDNVTKLFIGILLSIILAICFVFLTTLPKHFAFLGLIIILAIFTLLICGFPLFLSFKSISKSFNPAPVHDDNNSGVVALIHIAKLLCEKGYSDKVKLLFTDCEENGMLGSKLFVNNNINDLYNKIIINFDCIGRGSNIFITFKDNSQLAKELQCFFLSRNIDTTLSTKTCSDDKTFQNKGLNAIGITREDKDSKNNKLLHWTHTSHDTLNNINIDYIAEIIEVVAEFIEQI